MPGASTGFPADVELTEARRFLNSLEAQMLGLDGFPAFHAVQAAAKPQQ
jgi:hypothetical protein